jgi:hypothetical protein
MDSKNVAGETGQAAATWVYEPSRTAQRSFNPIRRITENLVKPNIPKSHISLSLGDPTTHMHTHPMIVEKVKKHLEYAQDRWSHIEQYGPHLSLVVRNALIIADMCCPTCLVQFI